MFVRQHGAEKIRRTISGGAELGKHGHNDVIRQPFEVIDPLLLCRQLRRCNPRPFPAARSGFSLPRRGSLPLRPPNSSVAHLWLGSQALRSHCTYASLARPRCDVIVGKTNPETGGHPEVWIGERKARSYLFVIKMQIWRTHSCYILPFPI